MRLTALASFTLLATLSAPSSAFAQFAPQFTAFGTHGANSNLVTQPLGASDCATPIEFVLSPTTNSSTTRFIDIWSASSAAAGCQMGSVRANITTPVCLQVASHPYVATNMTATLRISPVELFGTCESATRTFYFFDAAISDDNSDTFTTYWVLTAALDVSPPLTPVIPSTPVGDSLLQIPWNASDFTSLGPMGQVYVFAAPGCAAAIVDGSAIDAGTSSALVAGGIAPSTHLFATAAISPISLPTALLGWSTGHYGETDSLAIAAVDSAGNISPLSNVVCVEHASPPMTASSGCSVGLPGRGRDLGALAFALAALGALVARRARR